MDEEEADAVAMEQHLVNLENGNIDLQDMLAEALGEVACLREKHRLDHRAIQLLQRKAHALGVAADASMLKLREEGAAIERELRGQVAEKECQVMAAHAEAEQWKRRTGLLQLRLSSAQEDVDTYGMRARLLQAEVDAESGRAGVAEAELAAARAELAALQEQLQGQRQQEAALADALAQAAQRHASLEAQLAQTTAAHAQAREAAAAAAGAAAERLAQAQAEAQRLGGEVRAARREAARAGERTDEAEWRLQRQEASLAERLRVAGEAREATDGLSQEGLKAVREKASFLEAELRAQLDDARRFLADERAARRAAEAGLSSTQAGLGQRLEAAERELVGLRHQVQLRDARIAAPEETVQQRETANAMAVVSSLVDDLDPGKHRRAKAPATDVPADSVAAEQPGGADVAVGEEPPARQQPRKWAPKPKAQPDEAAAPAEGAPPPPAAKAAKRRGKQAAASPPRPQKQPKPRKRKTPEKEEEEPQAEEQPPARRLTRERASKGPWWAGSAFDVDTGADDDDGAATDAETEAAPAAKRAPEVQEAAAEPASRGRGQDSVAAEEEPANTEPAPAKRGRRKKEEAAAAAAAVLEEEEAAAGEPAAGPVPAEEPAAEEAAAPAAAELAARRKASSDSRRPSGVSKIDLTAVWGRAATPAAADSAPGQGKENAAAKAAASRVHKPVPSGSRFGSQSEVNPLAALNPGVLEAAMKARVSFAQTAPGKRKLLPAPKPMAGGAVGALPRSMLFGQNFQIPRLSRQ